ncbi:ribonuclease H [Fibrobacteres bacterium R8-0-B4]
MKKVEIFTDGACSGNPGPGGYGVVMRYGKREKELSGGYAETTNNRMELIGAIAALESLKEPCEVTVTTDSQYVVNAVEKGWARKWKAMGWMRNKKEPALNPDLWERLLRAVERHKVKFVWIRGHNGHAENERCDKLAVAASAGKGLLKDEGMHPKR